MNRLCFLLISFVVFSFANTTNSTQDEQKLESALMNPQTFEHNITSQVGDTYFYPTKHFGYFFEPTSSSNIYFSGIGRLSPVFKSKYNSDFNDDNSPAFMFVFEKRGDSLSIGGDIKGADFNYLNNYLSKDRE